MAKVHDIIIGISLAASLIILIFLMIAFSKTWFIYQFEDKGIYENVDKEIADSSIIEIIDLLKFKQDYISDFSEEEISHMLDVRKIICIFEYICIGFIFLLISMLFIFKNRLNIKNILRINSLTIITFIILVGLPFLINFESSFLNFHQIFFPQGNWAFDPSQYLMTRILTENIFFSFIFMYVGLLLFFAFITYYLSLILPKTMKKTS